MEAEKGERPVGVPAARGHGGDGGARLEVPAGGPAAPKVALQSLFAGRRAGPRIHSDCAGRGLQRR